MSDDYDFIMKRGDRLPSLECTLTGGKNNRPVDLTSATSIRAVALQNENYLFADGYKTVTGDASGVVVLPWGVGETDTVGLIEMEFQVTWPGSIPQSFPIPSKSRPSGLVRILIVQDLG